MPADGRLCPEHLRSRGFPASKIIVAGWSLGGAVAIDAASRHSVGGLIAFSTFTSSHDMARNLFPVLLPCASFWLISSRA